MPSRVVPSMPRSLTDAGTSRTVMSPMLTRSRVTGATRAMPLAVRTCCVKSRVAHVDAGAAGVLVGQGHLGGAGVDHHLDASAVDLGCDVVVAVGAGAQLDRPARRARAAGSERLGRLADGLLRRRELRQAEHAARRPSLISAK